MNFGAIFNLNIGRVFAITNCHMNLPFLDGYIVHLLFLVYLCLAVIVAYALAMCCWGKHDMELSKQYKQICVKILIMLITFMYPSICVKTFTGLRCTTVAPFATVDGTHALRVVSEDWNVLCNSGDEYWYNYTLLIYFAMAVVVVGVPMLVLMVLTMNRKYLFDNTSEHHEPTVMMFGPLFVQ